MSRQGRLQAPGPRHEQLGRGAMETLWQTTHPDTETIVALKVLNVTKIEHES